MFQPAHAEFEYARENADRQNSHYDDIGAQEVRGIQHQPADARVRGQAAGAFRYGKEAAASGNPARRNPST